MNITKEFENKIDAKKLINWISENIDFIICHKDNIIYNHGTNSVRVTLNNKLGGYGGLGLVVYNNKAKYCEIALEAGFLNEFWRIRAWGDKTNSKIIEIYNKIEEKHTMFENEKRKILIEDVEKELCNLGVLTKI